MWMKQKRGRNLQPFENIGIIILDIQKSKNLITYLANMLVFTAYSSKYVHGICVMQLIRKPA